MQKNGKRHLDKLVKLITERITDLEEQRGETMEEESDAQRPSNASTKEAYFAKSMLAQDRVNAQQLVREARA